MYLTSIVPCRLPAGHKYEVQTPGELGAEPRTKRGLKIIRQDEIDKVMNNTDQCCEGDCLSRWIDHFGPDMARAIITVQRAVTAGMDAVQRMMYHEDRLKTARDFVMKQPIEGGSKILRGNIHVIPHCYVWLALCCLTTDHDNRVGAQASSWKPTTWRVPSIRCASGPMLPSRVLPFELSSGTHTG